MTANLSIQPKVKLRVELNESDWKAFNEFYIGKKGKKILKWKQRGKKNGIK